MAPSPSRQSNRKAFIFVALLALGSAIAPWVHNHDYLRDFMDYGLVMSAAGRINAGEAPYVDFVTPIQAGFLHLNRLIEKAGGGTYLGMTQGALWAVMLGGAGIFLLLRPSLGGGIALGAAWSLVVCAPAQHTILWHNTWGVLTASLACIAAARLFGDKDAKSAGGGLWIVLASALCLGGINKLNFHLIALAGVSGIVLRGIFLGILSWRKATAAGLIVLGCGLAAPLAIELGATGASWSTWRYNVIDLAAADRAAYLKFLLQPGFYLTTVHDYYGRLRFPWIGAASVACFAFVVVAGWNKRPWLDRFALLVAAIGGAAGTLAALATNQDIAYVAYGLAVGLAGALLVTFRIRPRHRFAVTVAALLALLPAIAAWESAWQGKRSQFGHALSPRSAYEVLADRDPQFAYIAGLHIPPSMANSLELMGQSLPAPEASGAYPVFYAQSLEWLQRIWPAVTVRGVPLWMHNGTSYQESERQLVHRLISTPSRFAAIYDSVAWNFWPSPLDVPINMFCRTHEIGSDIRQRVPIPTLNREADDMFTINTLGINYLPELLHLEKGYFYTTETGALFMGTPEDRAVVRFDGIANQLVVRAVIKRLAAGSDEEIAARFLFEYDIDGVWHKLQEQTLTLPAGESELVQEIAFDGRRHFIRFTAEALDRPANDAIVGWFPPTMLHSLDENTPPPPLFRNPNPVIPVPDGFTAAAIQTDWIPDEIFLRGGYLENGAWWLRDGSQIWLKSAEGLGAFDGEITVTDPGEGRLPTVRIVWYKGGRLQVMEQFTLPHDSRTRGFHAWSSGPDGWFGVLIDAGSTTLPAQIKITKTAKP